MGIIRRSTMVLLSTLAALVIIVNSAEEEYEAQYRKEFRPRALDTGTPRTYEQPWRTMEVEPPIHPSTLEDTWMSNPTEEPLRRRRLGRKRKRQRDPASSQEELSQERFGYPEEPFRPYLEIDFSGERKMTETPKRRRKKLELRNRWEPPAEEDRPLRRRGQRRKRPTTENWPEFSEFGDYRPSGLIADTQTETATTNDDFRHFDEPEITPLKSPAAFELGLAEETGLKPRRPNIDALDKTRIIDDRDDIFSLIDNKHSEHKRSEHKKRLITNDDNKSDSEITIEDITSQHDLENDEHIKAREKLRDTRITYANEIAKAKERGSVDPLTLKDILKRSNGTSLSEILQQHNLSLTDLLHGKDKVLSILKAAESSEISRASLLQTTVSNKPEQILMENEEKEEGLLISNPEPQDLKEQVSENPIIVETTEFDQENTTRAEEVTLTTQNSKLEETSRRPTIRKFPTSIRRKQRIRPVFNNTLKSQISRDMLALNARKYFNHRRRNSSQEWRDLIPMMKKNISALINNSTTKKTEVETTTVTMTLEETTISQDVENCTTYETDMENNNLSEIDDVSLSTDSKNKTNLDKNVEDLGTAIYKTDKSTTTTPKPMSDEVINTLGLRRQAFNNRLKKKRLRQKNLTTEPPQDDFMRNLFGIPNLVSSSEFISQTQAPKTSIDDVSMTEDFITEEPRTHDQRNKTSRYSPSRSATTSQFVIVPSSKEDTAKIEIEEILNDTRTSARLSKILMERNMTLSELVEHRERGSSHVHLADIFQNAPKEPNSPEPFLSKSSIEPISKETYPLRALLDANIHDTTVRVTTIDYVPPALTTEVPIPVKMDFGNNVNENDENMGIMSLFHNITKKTDKIDKSNLMKDSDGTFYETTITVVNTTDVRNGSDTVRESRVIHSINDNNQDDVVSWNDVFTMMRKNFKNATEEFVGPPLDDLQAAKNSVKPIIDVDGDGLIIVLEDLQRLKDFDSHFETAAKDLDLSFNNFLEKAESPKTSLLDKIPGQTKSVTIAIASIAGLAMILFLLTYVGYRWHQQRMLVRKKSFSKERVPTPVFENRKGHKNNSSSRSISPMLSTSNIYTLNTLDSRNGKESPDYMWDSLRKPFQ